MLGSDGVIYTGQAQIHHGWSGSAKEAMGRGGAGPKTRACAERSREGKALPCLGAEPITASFWWAGQSGIVYCRVVELGSFVTLNQAWLSPPLIFILLERSDRSYYMTWNFLVLRLQ